MNGPYSDGKFTNEKVAYPDHEHESIVNSVRKGGFSIGGVAHQLKIRN